MPMSISAANRLGFAVLGLTNNFAYVVMLSAAYDLLKDPTDKPPAPQTTTDAAQNGTTEKYCNSHSTSTVLLADTLPSLTTKILYPFLLVSLPMAYKAAATAGLSAAAFLVTGLSSSKALIFTGVVCASFSSGLGESAYLSNTPLYGDVALSGWSIGTGAAGLLGAAAYALMSMFLPIHVIMSSMLVVPLAMLYAYFRLIVPAVEGQESLLAIRPRNNNKNNNNNNVNNNKTNSTTGDANGPAGNHLALQHESERSRAPVGAGEADEPLDMSDKLRLLPSLAKYFMPLLVVYFAEYFINQGLFELIYYPEIGYLDHKAQYRWFLVAYQLGVMISRSSLELLQIRHIWAMSLLQMANALLFLLHAGRLLHLPSFYLVLAVIVYEGLLGGFTYVNAFYRIKSEVAGRHRQEYCISAVTLADSLGIVMAALAALPVHDALCKLYQ